MAVYYMIEHLYKNETIPCDPILNNNSWEVIQQVAQHGDASAYWNIGDKKEVVLNGTIGEKVFSNYTCYAYIIGFNHNAALEGNNTIHFQLAFDSLNNGTNIAFVDSQYGKNDQYSTDAFRMNKTYSFTNQGGWKDSYMRNTIIPQLINALPSDLQAVLKPVNKYTDNYGMSSNVASHVTVTSDKVFPLAEYEVWGGRHQANQYEQNSQKQYVYYKINKMQKYKDTDTLSLASWWTRSPVYTNSMSWVFVGTSGSSGGYDGNYSYGFAPAFVVG